MAEALEEPSLPDPGLSIQRSHLEFPVVGIGASAGGLQATLRFFEHMPSDSGMAFVVILHLAPQHESTADKIIQGVTKMPVVQVTETVPIRPNHVYIISPAVHLEMSDGHLQVSAQKRPRGKQIAIDVFFRTLADAHTSRAIGIVLSGSGSDGSAGISRIKEQGGITIAQLPEDAEYDSMPASAIATTQIDLILPVVDIPQKIIDVWANARVIELPDPPDDLPTQAVKTQKDLLAAEQALREVLISLRTRTGHDFRQYKHATILRRIERRMQVNQIKTLPQYRDFLQSHPPETQGLLADLLISVTNFFRDREAFETLEREVIPKLLSERKEDEQLRIWVCGCATGEEAYSVAMLVCDEADNEDYDVQIFGTDIDERAIAIARTAAYPGAIVSEVPPMRLRRYFQRDEDHYTVKRVIREKVLFAVHNILRDPPFSKVHMVSCRNLLIYLSREVQREILQMFHFALRPGGYLFLGSSESADVVGDLFTPVDKKARIYRANTTGAVRLQTPVFPLGEVDLRRALPAKTKKTEQQKRASFADLHQRVLEQYAPPSVIVNRESQILHVSDRAGAFLRFVGGEPSNDLLDVVLPELRLELRTALYKAVQTSKSVEARRVRITRDDRKAFVNMTVRPFRDQEDDTQFNLVIFDEVDDTMMPDGKTANDEDSDTDPTLRELENELQRTKEDLQNTIEQSETSTEELKASNEELQAINEELRSATEELETSKEELQSMNEELVTVNFELKNKVDETTKVNDDLQNLISSTDLANIFVDRSLRIKRYTPGAAEIFNLIPTDIGRSLLDITHRLDYADLADDAAAAFLQLKRIDREIRSIDNRWYIARLVPYRTATDRIEGTVLTFIDITERKGAEDRARLGEERMRLADSIKDYAIITLDQQGLITSWNGGAEKIFGWVAQEAIGQSGDIIFTPEDRNAGAHEAEMRCARETGKAEDERWHIRKDGSRFYCSGVLSPVYSGELLGYAKIARDWTERKREEEEKERLIREEQMTLAAAKAENQMKDEFLAVMSHELKNPLNLIQITAEVLSRMPEVRNSQQGLKAVKTVQRSVQSQARIIDDLLDLSRLHTGKLLLERTEVDLAAVINALAATANNDDRPTAPEINVTGTEAPLLIQADPVRIEQIVGNLLSNALKFTGAYGSIDIALSKEDGCARVDVRDSGEGIAPHVLPRVFDMFRQGDNYATRAKGGLGIGLSLVRQLAEAHGGRVSVQSEGVGKGSQFTVWLPLDANLGVSQPLALYADSIFAGLSILLVDDEEEMLEAFRDLLSSEGASVVTAHSAPEALRLCQVSTFDLILSDIGMPDIDGYQFMKQLRSMPEYAEVPALAVTGFGRPADIKRALESGFSGHLSKPVGIDNLTQAYRRVMHSGKKG